MADNLFNGNDITVSQEIREIANPVFNTAKMTLFDLALSGDKDAEEILSKLGLNREKMQSSLINKPSQAELLCESAGIWIRFFTMNAIIEKLNLDTEIDLPCGYTPRAIKFARKNKKFVGLDLPAVINEFEPVVMSLIDSSKRDLVKFQAVDATNYDSLKKVFDDISGPVCITTEGLFMYFTESESAALCDNIRKILESHGGCWIMADPESFMMYVQAAKVFLGDNYKESLSNIRRGAQNKSDIHLQKFIMIISPRFHDIEGDTKRAVNFLHSHGLKHERLIVADYMPDLTEIAEINHDQAEKLKSAMRDIAFWKITLDDSQKIHESSIKSNKFSLDAKLISGKLALNLTGRLDTLSAPDLLAFYEKLETQHKINYVVINCSELDYISSAGLRVLLIIHKRIKNGVTLENINPAINDILVQTGFDSILNVK
ncbi:MAG: STAS domain-containing protein [Synergistaceae bacterium]|nr:STAS domain-containing protein [Synergistaceae bacterium]